jgi:flagellar basal body-associated protein FliL
MEEKQNELNKATKFMQGWGIIILVVAGVIVLLAGVKLLI